MRREFTLSATNPQFTVELTFTPSTIIVLNNTDQSVYLNIGRTFIPNATFFDREILPTASGIPSNVALPNNSYQFAGFLPTPTDTTKNVKVIFQGTSDPFSNKVSNPFRNSKGGFGGGNLLMGGGRMAHYAEYRLNAANPRQVMDLYFEADMIFILNNSDAALYLHQGGTMIPNATYSDLQLPPQSYTILNPHGGWQYAGFLDSPSQKDCFIIFCYGYADEYQRIKEALGDWDWYLPPLVLPELVEYFDLLQPIDPCLDACLFFDYALNDGCFTGDSVPLLTVYDPGVGWLGSWNPISVRSTAANFRTISATALIGSIQITTNSAVVLRNHSVVLRDGGSTGTIVYNNTQSNVPGAGLITTLHTPAMPVTADFLRIFTQFLATDTPSYITEVIFFDPLGNPVDC